MQFFAELYVMILPTMLQLIGAILGVLLIGAANMARHRWGIEIEARHREALHSAIMTGIRMALSRGASGSEATAAALEYAYDSVPDALEALAPSQSVLSQLADAKLKEAGG